MSLPTNVAVTTTTTTRVYCIKATRRASAPKGSLIASIPEAAPGRAPRAAVFLSMRTRLESSSPAPRLKNRVPQTTRLTGSQWREIKGRTEGRKAEASTPPTTASDAIRPQRGTVGCFSHTSARVRATSIGPTSHPAGRPTPWAKSPASEEPTPRTIHPKAVRIAFDQRALSATQQRDGIDDALALIERSYRIFLDAQHQWCEHRLAVGVDQLYVHANRRTQRNRLAPEVQLTPTS